MYTDQLSLMITTVCVARYLTLSILPVCAKTGSLDLRVDRTDLEVITGTLLQLQATNKSQEQQL